MLPEAVCNRIHTNHADAVETLSRLIGFPSVAAPQPQDGYPYGKPAADALDFMLHQLEELGMKVTRANDGKQAVELFSDNPADTAHVR